MGVNLMRMRLKGFLSVFSLLLLAFSVSFGAKSSISIESKIALENSLEGKLKSVLTELLGTERIIVSVNLDLAAVEEPKKEKVESSDYDDKGFVLPGVPTRKKVGEAEAPTPMVNLGASENRIRRMFVTVVLDQATPSADLQLAQKVTEGVLGLNADRGDRIKMETLAFHRDPPYHWSRMFVPPDLWRTASLFLAFLFTAAFLWSVPRLVQPLAASVKELAAKMQTQSAPGAGVTQLAREEPQAQVKAQSEKEPEASSPKIPGESAPFDFLTLAHCEALRYLLVAESPEVIAIVLHYVPAALSAKVLSQFSSTSQADVLRRLASTKQEDAAKVREVESKIKTKIQYLVGSEDKVSALIEEADGEERAALLSNLESADAGLSSRIKRQLVFVEDIRLLERPGLQALMRRVPLSVLARVIKHLQGDGLQGILSKLPEGVSERLRQEVELAPANWTRLKEDRKAVLDALKNLQREGLLNKEGINLSSGLDFLSRLAEEKGA